MKRIIIFLLLFLTTLLLPGNKTKAQDISAGIVSTSGSALNVRSAPSTTSSIKSKLQNNSYVTIYNTSGDFYYVEYTDNSYGYAHKSYIRQVSAASRIVSTNGGVLNVRSQGGTQYSLIDTIPNKERVIVLSSNGYWSKILYDGSKTGYVYNPYLTKATSGTRLNVTSYKQFDPRWAYLEVGQSGKTVKQIGCLITSISMTEEYERGYTYTPKAVLQNNTFTQAGAIYWPSDYKITTSSYDYKNKIASILDSGKPVIIGCKNQNGGTHYVVIYAYTDKNNASSFLINDPGSSTRKTLKDFLNAYPYFLKYAYNV